MACSRVNFLPHLFTFTCQSCPVAPFLAWPVAQGQCCLPRHKVHFPWSHAVLCLHIDPIGTV
jgi:hypothetical protein